MYENTEFPMNMKEKKIIALYSPEEKWIRMNSIKGYEDILPKYFISNFGRAYPERIGLLRQTTSFDYLYVQVTAIDIETGERYAKRIRTHRLVMLGFHYFDGCEVFEVNHKDGCKQNNREWNLEWTTSKDNSIHAANTGLTPCGEKSYKAVITNQQAIEICELLSVGDFFTTEIAEMLGITKCVVGGIARRNSWKQLSVNYTFRKRILRRFPNSTLMDLINLVLIYDECMFSSRLEYFTFLLANTTNDEYITKYTYALLDDIDKDPFKYVDALNNCAY